MTYRNDASYLRFPETIRTLPEQDIEVASELMDKLLDDEKKKHQTQDLPAAMADHNVYDAID